VRLKRDVEEKTTWPSFCPEGLVLIDVWRRGEREDNNLRSGAKKGGIGLTYWSIMEAMCYFVQNVESFKLCSTSWN